MLRQPATRRRDTSLWLAWGVGTAVLYLAVVARVWWPIPVHLLYDGFVPPQPYHWVRPPLDLVFGNRAPEPGAGTIALTASGSSPAAVLTGDAQAGIIFPEGVIEGPTGESSVQVTITPLDPARLARAPVRLRFDGNAYRIDAVYAVSRKPVVLRKAATVVLRYPTGATELLQFSGSKWMALETHAVQIAFQVYASTPTLGAFVAAGPPTGGAPVSLWVYRIVTALLGIAIVVVLAGLARDYARHRRRQQRDEPRR